MDTFFPSTSAGIHSSDWTAGAWAGVVALFLVAGAIGVAAATIGRLSYWLYKDHDRRSAPLWLVTPAIAVVLWLVSLWPLISSLTRLARHSRSIEFASLFTAVGTLALAACYSLAVPASTWLASQITGDYYGDRNPPEYLFLVTFVPAVLTVLVGLGVHINERAYREGALSVLLESVIGLIIFGGLVVLMVKAARALQSHLDSRQY